MTALYAELDGLAAEKIALAERLVKLFERAMARLEHDLHKILKLQGDEPGLPPTQHFLSAVESTAQQLQTSLRAASAAVAEVPAPPPPAAAAPPQKSKCVRARPSPRARGDVRQRITHRIAHPPQRCLSFQRERDKGVTLRRLRAT